MGAQDDFMTSAEVDLQRADLPEVQAVATSESSNGTIATVLPPPPSPRKPLFSSAEDTSSVATAKVAAEDPESRAAASWTPAWQSTTGGGMVVCIEVLVL